MKHRRRIDRFHRTHFWLFQSELKAPDFVIPPRSLVQLKAEMDWGAEYVGVPLRVGYYRPSDGLDCVWLVNKNAEYFATTDQASILDDFQILIRSDETDLFGRDRDVLEPIA